MILKISLGEDHDLNFQSEVFTPDNLGNATVNLLIFIEFIDIDSIKFYN